jgi:antibiotic biosynthesis monooxygenase (ABM) superfamily enzyme
MIKVHHMPLHHDDNLGDGPVTVIVTRKAKKGRVSEFEEWMDGIIHEAMKFEGHMGVNIIRPPDPSNPEYVVIFRFNTYENLAKWEKSEIRKEWLDKSKEVVEGEATVEKQTGLEFWFTPRPGINNDKAPAAMAPPRYKMAIVITGIIFVLVSVLLPQIRQLTIGLPVLLSTLVGVVMMVLLMTYVIMPSVTRLLRPWLAKKRLF